ncbi:hypothetical protein [Modestobacter sp. NPDC049651]|uniref:hypothetical protein n=1 Tax=unclassified Modestobacter TaxID=2643866 RepID=UPI0033F639A9
MSGRSDWPDQGEWDHWEAALRDVADRLRQQRGVEDPWSLTVEFGGLWANYGDFRIQVAGPHTDADPLDTSTFSDEIDDWVAWDRRSGPGVRLDRDLQAMADWRARLPLLQQLWEQAAPRVFRDVTAAAGRDVPWQVVLQETETVSPDWPGPPRQGIWIVEGEVELRERELDFPRIVLELPHTTIHLMPLAEDEDVEDAVATLAGEVQDEVIEEVHGAWPTCLAHEHPMRASSTEEGPARWRCPTDHGVSVPIGQWDPVVAGWRS